jgi:cardiolipin synthase A/B
MKFQFPFILIRWLFLAILLVLVMLTASPPAGATPATDTTLFLPLVGGPLPGRLLIAAAHIDSALSGEADEAILLWNVGDQAQSLAGWQLITRSRTTTFPLTTTLTIEPGGRLWCAAEAAVFRTSFGAEAACEWRSDSEPAAVDLDGALTLANGGGMIQLRNPNGQVIDTLLYGTSEEPAEGWEGLPAQRYDRGDMPSVGQVWQRKFDPQTFTPIDSDRAGDWSGDLSDPAWGRRVRLPGWGGWNAHDLGRVPGGVDTAAVTVLVGPEGLYGPLAAYIQNASTSIDLVIYTFEQPELAQHLAAAAQRGVRVRVLAEGSPAGGISTIERWCLAQIAAAGGDVRFLAVPDDAPTGARPRYRFVHAKYLVIDDRLAINGTENFSYNAFPLLADGAVGGRRGYYLATDAAPVVDALRQIFATDWAPDRFRDLRPFDPNHEKYGAPPEDFVLPEHPIYDLPESPFREAQTFSGEARFQVVSAPENALRPDDGLLALIGRTGAGDEILVEQLYEHRNWGMTTSNPIADPNPRLEAVIAAARRGVRVRVLLDALFDDQASVRNNLTTVDYLNSVANAEGLDLEARRGNPTGGGIHAKLFLIRVGDERWTAVGSLNGGETSFKLNREVVVLTDLAGVHTRLAEVFAWDWALSD